MQIRVIMPQLGESVVEGTVSRWLKQAGDQIKEYEPLIEVSTDKVDTEIPAPASGILGEVYVNEGQTVEAGTVLALIETVEEPSKAVPQREFSAGNGKVKSTVATSQGYSGHVTPVVARMAAEHHLDLARIKGTGRDGRITKKDVEAFLEAEQSESVPAWEQPLEGDLFKPTVEYSLQASAKLAQAQSEQQPSGTPPADLIPHSPMRRAIAEHMVRSQLQTAPHVTTVFEADMRAVMDHRETHKDGSARQGVKLTLTAYFVAASVQALQAHPRINGQWTETGIRLNPAQHIGLAVALDDGLIVPVIKNAQDLNLTGLARAINDLSERARRKQLKPEEVQGGTFTLTNHGVNGSLFATPIINQPQSAILGVGLIEKRVKVIDDAIAICPMCYLSLTFDHRLIDGAVADTFMQTLKDILETWG